MRKLFQRWQARGLAAICIAALLSWLVASDWLGSQMEWLADGLFAVFLPGTLMAGMFTGGAHSLSELDVGVGVFVEVLLLWVVVEWIVAIGRQRKRDSEAASNKRSALR